MGYISVAPSHADGGGLSRQRLGRGCTPCGGPSARAPEEPRANGAAGPLTPEGAAVRVEPRSTHVRKRRLRCVLRFSAPFFCMTVSPSVCRPAVLLCVVLGVFCLGRPWTCRSRNGEGPLVFSAAPSVSGGVQACHDSACPFLKRDAGGLARPLEDYADDLASSWTVQPDDKVPSGPHPPSACSRAGYTGAFT